MRKIKNKIIENKVYEYRVLSHLSQSALAKKIGVSTQAIYSIENKKSIPNLRIAYRISNFLMYQ